MSCIIRITNKSNGNVYAYESESYRDPVTKKPKSRRTYLGRVDPVTNEIIPKAEKGKRNRQSSTKQLNQISAEHSAMQKEIEEQKKELQQLRDEYNRLASRCKIGDTLLEKLKQLVEDFDEQLRQE